VPGAFETTRWSLVIAAGDSTNPQARQALDALCRIYWPPIYAYLRRRGEDARRAEDLTQGFFLKLLEQDGIGRARAERGKFRTFLLSSLKNYLVDEHDRESAIKRGGGKTPLSLDAREDEEWLIREPAHEESPEKLFDRRWAATVIARALERLERVMLGSVGPERFAALRPFLSATHPGAYAEVARALGIGESAVRVGVHRMRRQFGECLRDEVAQTVESESDVEDELRHLQRIVRA
jgi:RNA polymerase sigma-70 factor (ECF subfamily)